MPYDVYLDVSRKSSRVMAHVLDPPGLGIRFEDRQAFEAGVSRALYEHLQWLASHRFLKAPPVSPEAVAWRLAEEQPIEGDFESGDDVGFYAPDAVPLTCDDIERYLLIARRSREELVALVRSLPPEAMEWRYDERSRTIRQILRHVANAEFWYITRLIEDPDRAGMPAELAALDQRMDRSPDPVERLLTVREGLESFFRSTPLDLLNRIVTPTWFCDVRTERWTGRKALRRTIEHEREHIRSIRRTLASCEPAPGASLRIKEAGQHAGSRRPQPRPRRGRHRDAERRVPGPGRARL